MGRDRFLRLFAFSFIAKNNILSIFSRPLVPELKWVDRKKPLFKVSTKLVSTVNTEVSFEFADRTSVFNCIYALSCLTLYIMQLGTP